jgi:hypothetical protein
LLFDIDRPLELPSLGLGLLLLAFRRRSVAIVCGLSLLVLDTLAAGRLWRNAAVAGLSQGVALGLACLLLLLEFRLLLHQALSDVVHASGFVEGLPAELALDFGCGGLEGTASW